MMSVIRKVEQVSLLRYRPVTSLRINCGCGFRAETVEEAEQHAQQTGHTLEIKGTVRVAA